MAGLESFNIEQYKSRFGDGAKASLFYYTPNWPSAIDLIITPEDAMYLVRSSSGIPTTTREEAILNWQGFDYKYATKSTYEAFTITFSVDLKAKIRFQFEQWMNLIHNPIDNTYGVSSQYMQDQTLQLIGYQAENLLEVTFHHAWPQSVAAIALDYATPEVAMFDVTFSYQYHTFNPSEKGGFSNLSGNIG